MRLNRSFVSDRIDRLGLRRWWLAEQLGIDRRTLTRWLSGATAHVPRAKLEQLAGVLGTNLGDVVAGDSQALATSADQVEAVRALLASNLLESMMPAHQFAVYEKLAKGLIVPGLAKRELGELYMAIALAVFRQSKLAEAARFARMAHALGEETGDLLLVLRANMQLSYRAYLRGHGLRALEMDERNLALARELGHRRLTAANLSNLGDQYLMFCRYQDSRRFQKQAIQLYRREPVPTSLTFCYLGLFLLDIETEDFAQARCDLDAARAWAMQGEFRRGGADCDLSEAALLAALGNAGNATVLMQRAFAGYDALGIRETRMYAIAGRIERLAGHPDRSERRLAQGLDLARELDAPILAAELHAELAATLRGRNADGARRHAARAAQIYGSAGMHRRAAALSAAC